jgi:hypothetical protein
MLPSREQWKLFEAVHGEDFAVQGCRPDFRLGHLGRHRKCQLRTVTVTPSLDGSAGRLWHGFITGGEIK